MIDRAFARKRFVWSDRESLLAIKLTHTAIWACLSACILTLPILALAGRFQWALIFTVIVIAECSVLAMNDGRCPLTDWAACFTKDRSENFDIFLPRWLARHNKLVFGTIFLAGETLLAACWLLRP